jgi:hypothetical protein
MHFSYFAYFDGASTDSDVIKVAKMSASAVSMTLHLTTVSGRAVDRAVPFGGLKLLRRPSSPRAVP